MSLEGLHLCRKAIRAHPFAEVQAGLTDRNDGRCFQVTLKLLPPALWGLRHRPRMQPKCEVDTVTLQRQLLPPAAAAGAAA